MNDKDGPLEKEVKFFLYIKVNNVFVSYIFKSIS